MKNGTPILWQRVSRVPVSRLLTILFVCLGLLVTNAARPQCGAGTTKATLNWDILDYLTTGGTYSADNYINTTIAYTQNFAFGAANRLTIAPHSTFTLGGEVSTHTGDVAGYTGDDVMFTPTSANRAITLTFETAVNDLNFTLYDIEAQQAITITANGGLVPVNVTTYTGTILTIGAVPLARTITANNASAAQNVNAGTATVSIAGPVTSVTINVTNIGTSNSDFYLSDISACVTGTFPLNYYTISQPWTGQPGYVLHAFNRSVYYVDPATGFTRLLFSESNSPGNDAGTPATCTINSLAYDPYNKYIYYVYSLTNSGTSVGNSTMMRRYDVNTGTRTTLIADLETIGLPTTDDYGTESGSAAFYNGSYYIGVETSQSGRNSGREAVIWRIDFNGSGIPSRCSQVFAQPIDSSGLLMHDWSDFVIYDGTLYNFDAAENDTRRPSGCMSAACDYLPSDRNQSDIYHVDLMTGNYVRYTKPGLSSVPLWYPGQPAITWNGTPVQLYANSSAGTYAGSQPFAAPYVALYNGAGGIGTTVNMFATPSFPANPSLGDAAEAFKPRCDFGDAPSSYDNSALAPAVHELDPLIRLGASMNIEWNRTNSALADAEGAEENAIGAAPTLNYNATLNYTISNIQVFNNTGGQARLIAWLDYNFDGVWQPSEGVSVLVNSSASMQSVNLTWPNIWVPMTSNLRTFVRFRLSRASNGMTTSNVNGWASDGEVEDFPVTVGVALPKDIQSFDVMKKANTSVDVKWSINVQQQVKDYTILRSNDNINWVEIGTVAARDGFGLQNYTYADQNPAPGKSYYRIRVNYESQGANKLSEVRAVQFDNSNVFVRVLPNPAHEQAELQVNALNHGDAMVRVYDRSGRMVIQLKQAVEAGSNSIRLQNLSKLAEGVYTVRTIVNGRTTSNQLIIKKQ